MKGLVTIYRRKVRECPNIDEKMTEEDIEKFKALCKGYAAEDKKLNYI